MDYRQIYDMETYLFTTVRQRFADNGYLDAFDFFCIIIWKANRAKTRVTKRVLSKGHQDLDAAIRDLTGGIAHRRTPKERFYYLWSDWGFRLPMATAILTVLYPDEFTIYDTRVCSQLGDFDNLASSWDFEAVWQGYQCFKERVMAAAPSGLSLRDKDRWLWGKSFHDQLTADIRRGFAAEAT